jgi:ribulose-5-phosphate 4-epimerase/fuculose-1-phosphate aldolase
VRLANHWVLVFRRTPELAVQVGGIIEEAAQAGLSAGSLGGPVEIPEELRPPLSGSPSSLKAKERRTPDRRTGAPPGIVKS